MTQDPPAIPYPLAPAPTIYHPSPDYTRMRETCPVARVELPDGACAYLATRHADVRRVFTTSGSAGPPRPARTARPGSWARSPRTR